MTRGERPRRPGLIVEILGLPGAGKTSVYDMLLERSGDIRRRETIKAIGGRYAAFQALAGAAVTLFRHAAFNGRDSEQLHMVAYLQTVPRLFGTSSRSAHPRVLLFDQGPIYDLSRPRLRHRRLEKWWEQTFETWAALIGLVVVLDAPDGLLKERIDSRTRWHRYQGAPDETVLAGLAAARRTYDEMLERLVDRPSAPVVLRFDTSLLSVDEIVEAILGVIEKSDVG